MIRFFLFIISLGFIFSDIHPIFGGWKRRSFQENDARINNSFKALKEKMLGNSNSRNELYPISIYSQVVNGINYKIIAAFKDSEKKRLNLVNSIAYTNLESTTPSDTSYEILQNNNYGVNNEYKALVLKNELNKYLIKLGANLVDIISIDAHPNIVYDDGFYIYNVNISINGTKSHEFFIIKEEKNLVEDRPGVDTEEKTNYTVMKRISFD